MRLKRSWQRGTADLVSIGVGLVILGTVMAGTTACLFYGRDALIREQHYKQAAYLLRGKMEEVASGLQLAQVRGNPTEMGPYLYPAVPLDLSVNREDVVMVRLYRHRIEPVYDFFSGRINYYRIKVSASWEERDLAPNRRGGPGITRSITFTTSLPVRALL